MQKIYIDTNIISRLRINEAEEYQKLTAFLTSNRANLIVPFSAAHIDDLINDSTDEKIADAIFLEELTANHYFSYDALKHQINFNSQKPIDLLNIQLASPKNPSFENITDVFDAGGDPELKKILDPLKQFLEAQIHSLNVDIEKLRPKDEEYISKFLPPINTNLSALEMFSSIMSVNEQLKDKSTFKDMRRYNLDVFSSFTNIKDITLEAINTALKTSVINKDLSELISSHNQSSREQTLNEKFSSGFILLNFSGLDKEKNKKANYVSLNNDAQHAFFASYCNILITNDDGLKLKSKLLYENYNISTQVFDIHEFLNTYNFE